MWLLLPSTLAIHGLVSPPPHRPPTLDSPLHVTHSLGLLFPCSTILLGNLLDKLLSVGWTLKGATRSLMGRELHGLPGMRWIGMRGGSRSES